MKLFGSLLTIILAAGNATGFAQTNPTQTNTPLSSPSLAEQIPSCGRET